MKKLTCIFLLVIGTGLQIASAQVPGFQGKRFSVGYNASSFFYWTDFTFGTIIESTALSYKTELIANYTVSRKVTMGFSYYFANQKDNFGYLVQNTNYYNYNSYHAKADLVLCKLAIYELHFQFFRKNFVAPVGLYHQVSVGMVKYDLAKADNPLVLYGESGQTLNLDGPTDPFSCFKLGYAIGKTNPIGHRFYINTAIGVNFFRGGDGAKIKTEVTERNYILANFNRNLRTHNSIEIKIGLGCLAF
jgi:hypothetical protein